MKFKYIYSAAALGLLFSCGSSKSTTVSDSTSSETLDRSVRPSAAKAKEITIGNYEEFTLENGLKVFVIENHKFPTISFNLSFDIDPILEGKKAGYISLVGSLIEAGTTTKEKEVLDEKIDFMGANIGATSSGVYASGLSKYKNEIMDLFADMTLHPSFPSSEFEKQIKQTLTNIEASEDNPDQIASNMKNLVFYGKNHPYGEFETETTVNNIKLEDCKNYYESYFKPNNGLLTIVGDISVEDAKKLVNNSFGAWEKAEIEDFPRYEASNPASPQVTVIDKDGAVQSNIYIGNLAELKLGDADYEPVKVLNEIFGGSFSGRLFQNIREDKGYTYGAYGSVDQDHLIGEFSAYAKVRNSVTDSALDQFIYEIKRIRTENAPADEIQNAKNYIAGVFAQRLERPGTLASFAKYIEEYNLDKDYFKNYLKRIDAVTADDIKRVANKYMLPENIQIVVVGNAAEIGPKLERFGKVTYLDKEGNETSAPSNEKLDVTVEEVLDMHIKAIGGKEKLASIKSIKTEMTASMQGMTLTMVQSQKAPNKSALSMSMMGMNVMNQVFDGKNMTIVAQGMKQPSPSEEELEDMRISNYLFPELIYAEKGVKTSLKGMKEVNGEKTYEVETIYPNGKKTLSYISKESGMKLRETAMEEGPEGPVSQSTDYSNYKKVGGVMFPHKITIPAGGGMYMDAEVKSIELNTEIDDAIFIIE